jgi:DNA topoisomerase-3
LALEWARGRVFENEVGAMLLRPVSEANVATVLSVVRKEKCRTRPTALNTVEMMRVCSSGLGMGPHHAMGVAERLYIQVRAM